MVVYWYFSFTNTNTLSISNFLCSIAKDLCSKLLIVPDEVESAWSDANNGQHRPNTKNLIHLIQVILDEFDDVYLVIDGIDEFPRSERDNLLDVFGQLIDFGMSSLHLMLSSRREGDIMTSMKDAKASMRSFHEVQVDSSDTKLDIRKYLQQRLKSRHFRRWPDDEKTEVTSRLITYADGM